MAYRVRKVPTEVVFALVAAWNAKQEAAVASFFHADKTQISSGHYTVPTVANDTVATANSSSEATAIALANALKAAYNRHVLDDYAHNTALSAVVATADASSLATAITLANALKAAYNTHLAAASVHFNNDGTNTVAADDATDQTTINTLLNEMKGDYNAHVISAPTGSMVRLVDA